MPNHSNQSKNDKAKRNDAALLSDDLCRRSDKTEWLYHIAIDLTIKCAVNVFIYIEGFC